MMTEDRVNAPLGFFLGPCGKQMILWLKMMIWP
jgi:hypothetical protein